jgi:hypothetical protein
MSVTLIAYPTTSFINDLAAWNNFNTRADADGADTKEEACFDCLYARFAPSTGCPNSPMCWTRWAARILR